MGTCGWRSKGVNVCEIIFKYNFQNDQPRSRQRKFSVGVGGVRRRLETLTDKGRLRQTSARIL